MGIFSLSWFVVGAVVGATVPPVTKFLLKQVGWLKDKEKQL